MTTRYLVFGYNVNTYNHGGWNDHLSNHDISDNARAAARRAIKPSAVAAFTHAHVVDLETGKIIFEAKADNGS